MGRISGSNSILEERERDREADERLMMSQEEARLKLKKPAGSDRKTSSNRKGKTM